MDPNVLLFELRSAVEEFTRTHDADNVDEVTSRVLHAWSDLDEWITRGGFLPDLWVEAQRRALENTRVTPGVQTSDVSRSDASRSDGQTSDVSEAGSIEELSTLIDGDPWRA